MTNMPSLYVVLSPTGLVIDSSSGLKNVHDKLCNEDTVVSFITSAGTIRTITKKYDWDVRCSRCVFQSGVCPNNSRGVSTCATKGQGAPSIYYSRIDDILEEL